MKTLGLQVINCQFCGMQNGPSKYQEKDIEQMVLENRAQAEEITSLRAELEYYKHELDKLKRMIFGSKSERYIPVSDGQLALGLETDTIEQKPAETEDIAYTRQKPNKESQVSHFRAPIPSHLPREEYIIKPEGDLNAAKKIGEEITEILEYTPGRLYVKKYIRYKYALPQDGGVLIGELPSFPIPKGNAGPGLLAHLAVSKFVDHLPFYRQSQMLKREGLEIAESTINGWFTATCTLLAPLYERLCDTIIRTPYLMVDETPIPVLTKDKP
ncbi:MAG TPA: IS66 family transposase, partial [Salinimicrobium catena]|nr:IS66 family transposase [Salinimicrobium catena]